MKTTTRIVLLAATLATALPQYHQPQQNRPQYHQPQYHPTQPQYHQSRPQQNRPQYHQSQPQYHQPQPQNHQPQYHQPQPQQYQPQQYQPQQNRPQYHQPQYHQPQYHQPQHDQPAQPVLAQDNQRRPLSPNSNVDAMRGKALPDHGTRHDSGPTSGSAVETFRSDPIYEHSSTSQPSWNSHMSQQPTTDDSGKLTDHASSDNHNTDQRPAPDAPRPYIPGAWVADGKASNRPSFDEFEAARVPISPDIHNTPQQSTSGVSGDQDHGQEPPQVGQHLNPGPPSGPRGVFVGGEPPPPPIQHEPGPFFQPKAVVGSWQPTPSDQTTGGGENPDRRTTASSNSLGGSQPPNWAPNRQHRPDGVDEPVEHLTPPPENPDRLQQQTWGQSFNGPHSGPQTSDGDSYRDAGMPQASQTFSTPRPNDPGQFQHQAWGQQHNGPPDPPTADSWSSGQPATDGWSRPPDAYREHESASQWQGLPREIQEAVLNDIKQNGGGTYEVHGPFTW